MTSKQPEKKAWSRPEVILISSPQGGSHGGTHEGYFIGSSPTGGGFIKLNPKPGKNPAYVTHPLNYYYS